MAKCESEACDRTAEIKGLCRGHRRRQRNGSAIDTPISLSNSGKAQAVPIAEHFRRRAIDTGLDTCWEWGGFVNAAGYPYLVASGKKYRAHRVSWELANGPIPEGALVDHICHTPTCTNPRHLRIATHSENGANRSGPAANNSSGYRGVHRVATKGLKSERWKVQVKHEGKLHYGGMYEDPAVANLVAIALRERLHGDFAS